MDRRSFIQTAGNVAALSVLHGGASPLAPGTPGKILAIAAHPGDGMFTMGATLAQQIERGGSGVLLSLSLGEKGAPKDIPIQQYGEMQRAGHREGRASAWGRGNVSELSRCRDSVQ
jgi:GlcNAc-PI de-N-acetylase